VGWTPLCLSLEKTKPLGCDALTGGVKQKAKVASFRRESIFVVSFFRACPRRVAGSGCCGLRWRSGNPFGGGAASGQCRPSAALRIPHAEASRLLRRPALAGWGRAKGAPPSPALHRRPKLVYPAPAEAESPQGAAGLATRQPAERPAGSSCKAPATPRPHRGLEAGDGKGGQEKT
jgi:hypothetical protein